MVVRAAGAGLLHEAGVVLGQHGHHVVELVPLVSLQRGVAWENFSIFCVI